MPHGGGKNGTTKRGRIGITAKSSDDHQQLDQSESTTLFHFFPLFLCLERNFFSGTAARNRCGASTVPYELDQFYAKKGKSTTAFQKKIKKNLKSCK